MTDPAAEFLTAALYFSPDPDHRDILDRILAAFDQENQRPGGFPRELLDIGIRSALATGDHGAATRLARAGKASVRPSFALFQFLTRCVHWYTLVAGLTTPLIVEIAMGRTCL